MEDQYRLMMHFVVATLHFYRDDLILLKEHEPLSTFSEKNKAVIQRVEEEAKNLFNYELSWAQIGKGIAAYLTPAQSLANTEAATLSPDT